MKCLIYYIVSMTF